jgi:hypothetical protein
MTVSERPFVESKSLITGDSDENGTGVLPVLVLCVDPELSAVPSLCFWQPAVPILKIIFFLRNNLLPTFDN